MRMSAQFLYLNRDNCWPDFQPPYGDRKLLDLGADGSLGLAALPAPDSTLPDDLPLRPVSDGPAGLAVGPDRIPYWTDPTANSVMRLDSCAGSAQPQTQGPTPGVNILTRPGSCTGPTLPVPCLGGTGTQPTRFQSPRGLMFHSGQGRLYVADTGNHRVQIFDPRTWQLTGLWGQPTQPGPLQPGTGDGQFNGPLGLAHDADGFVYVADTSNGRVQKFDPHGLPIPSFSRPSTDPTWRPTAVAVARDADGTELVFVLDHQAGTLTVLATDGQPQGKAYLGDNKAPSGLAVLDGGATYIGDNDALRIRKYQLARGSTPLLGSVGAAHYHGPVTALASDGCGGLLVLPGGGPPLRLVLSGGRVPFGGMWGGPFPDPTLVVESWHRLKALVSLPDSGASIQLYIRKEISSTTTVASPWDPAVTTSLTDRPDVQDLTVLQDAPLPVAPAVAFGAWYRAPGNAPECLFPGAPHEYLWVAVAFTSDGEVGATLSQLRLDFQYEELAGHVPDCYFDNLPGRGLVSRMVGLFASLFEDADTAIDGLPVQFAPKAAPEAALGDLAALLGLKLSESQPAALTRQAIAGAFARNAKRGTAEGLVEAFRNELGVRAVVEEPIRMARVWVLPGDDAGSDNSGANGVGSLLGLTTMLASSEPQGAVVGSTLTLDQTELLSDEEIGLPLFSDLAHRLVVRVPWRADPSYVQGVRELLDREVPCHVAYELCFIEPRMRIGIQARLGIDAVLAGPPLPTLLCEGLPGPGLVLGGDAPGRLGPDSRLGQNTYLGQTAVEPPTPGESLP
jgi:phage tail-like protein